MKILVITDWLAPYRIDLFNEIGKYEDITILYADVDSAERDKRWKSEFANQCDYIQGRRSWLNGRDSHTGRLKSLIDNNNFDIIYVDGYGSISQIKAIRYLSKKGIPYFLNIDGALIRERERSIVTKAKKWILNRDCYYLCGSTVSNKYLMHYGVDKSRIYNHPFTSLYEHDMLATPPTSKTKEALRTELGMHEKYIILSVGRFTYLKGYGKGYDAILRAASHMPKEYGFYIVGDEPTDEFIKMRESLGATNVHFVGFKNKNELSRYYQAADLFVLMTVYDVWGLVVNEAMANGLPVITTDMCVAGLELVRDGHNGYIVTVGDDEALQQKIALATNDSTNLSAMSNNALETIKEYTIENVARQHINVFKAHNSSSCL